MTIRVGIVGASGYTGGELLRLVSAHPDLEITRLAAGRSAGQSLDSVWPGLTDLGVLDDRPMDVYRAADVVQNCDAVFLALPHGISAEIAPELVDNGLTVVDLGADFRLKDPATYARHYGKPHPCPERLSDAVYGLVEWHRDELHGAKLIANPGCYPTAVSLAVRPFVKAGLVGDLVIADCLSGVSGAGRDPSATTHFCTVSESATAYKPGGTHRHVPEIEQSIGKPVTFTPHLIPINRGMVATVHFRPTASVSLEELTQILVEQYQSDTMISVRDDVPSTADVRGTNRAHVHVCFDHERNMATVISVIDNLLKGASGQAVQALNVALGMNENTGLPLFPLTP